MQHAAFAHDSFLIRRKVFKLFGASFHVYADDGALIAFSKQKAFKLKEDVRLFSDESMQEEVLRINARSVIDFSAAYDVFDPVTNEPVGVLRRRGMKSLVRDAWDIADVDGRSTATMQEDSTMMGIVRRLSDNWSWLFPQKFHVDMNGEEVCTMKQHMNPFVQKMDVRFAPNAALDRRLGVAAAVLVAAIEGRQG